MASSYTLQMLLDTIQRERGITKQEHVYAYALGMLTAMVDEDEILKSIKYMTK